MLDVREATTHATARVRPSPLNCRRVSLLQSNVQRGARWHRKQHGQPRSSPSLVDTPEQSKEGRCDEAAGSGGGVFVTASAVGDPDFKSDSWLGRDWSPFQPLPMKHHPSLAFIRLR